MSQHALTVLMWLCLVPGALVWLAVLVGMAAVIIQPRSSSFLTYGCADCDWDLGDARRYRWWTLRLRYRTHRVRTHRDWPPIYRRTRHKQQTPSPAPEPPSPTGAPR